MAYHPCLSIAPFSSPNVRTVLYQLSSHNHWSFTDHVRGRPTTPTHQVFLIEDTLQVGLYRRYLKREAFSTNSNEPAAEEVYSSRVHVSAMRVIIVSELLLGTGRGMLSAIGLLLCCMVKYALLALRRSTRKMSGSPPDPIKTRCPLLPPPTGTGTCTVHAQRIRR